MLLAPLTWRDVEVALKNVGEILAGLESATAGNMRDGVIALKKTFGVIQTHSLDFRFGTVPLNDCGRAFPGVSD